MTNQQILEKAWQIATDRGWEFDNLDKWQVKVVRKTDTVMNEWYQYVFTYKDLTRVIDAERIIYDQYFAKALWGEKDFKTGYIFKDIPHEQHYPMFAFHLREMVISPDPISYLGQHI